MRGLVYKELYLTRRTMLGFLRLGLGMAVLGILFCISMNCGNLRQLRMEDPEAAESMVTMFLYLPEAVLLCAAAVCGHSVYGDYASGWMKYSYTLPVSAKKAVGARYLAGAVIVGAGGIFSMLYACVLCGIVHRPAELSMIKNMLGIMMLGLAFCFLMIPMALKYRTAPAVSNRLVAVGVAFYLLAGGVVMRKAVSMGAEESGEYLEGVFETLQKIFGRVVVFSPLIIAVLFAVSFFLSVKLYQRREK